MTIYRKRRATLTWHWSSACSGWPGVDFDEQERFPTATANNYCRECLALSRSPVGAAAYHGKTSEA